MRFWIGDALVPAESARIDVLDHGFTVGDGVFETLRTAVDGSGAVVPFALDRHLARLAVSAAGMGFRAPDPEEVREALLQVCAANPELAAGGRLRVTLTSGTGPLGSDRTAGEPTLAVVASAAVPWPASTALAVSPWPRNERSPLVGLKSTSYAENVLVLAWAKARGAGEALLVNLAGDVCEGTGSNIFLVTGGQVTTPPLSSGCLAGITRGLVLEWCADAGIAVDEVEQPVASIALAEEMFITSSTRDVHPVSGVVDQQGIPMWPGPAGGAMTVRIREIFAQRAQAQWNP